MFSTSSFLLGVRVILENHKCTFMFVTVRGTLDCHVIVVLQSSISVFVCNLLVNTLHLHCPSASPTYWVGLGWLSRFPYERPLKTHMHANTHGQISDILFAQLMFAFLFKWDTRDCLDEYENEIQEEEALMLNEVVLVCGFPADLQLQPATSEIRACA